ALAGALEPGLRSRQWTTGRDRGVGKHRRRPADRARLLWHRFRQRGGAMMSVEFLREQIVHGLISGAMYALMASGLSLIWGTMRVLNFAHGEFFMLGGFFALAAMQTLGLGPLWSGAIAVVAVFL